MLLATRIVASYNVCQDILIKFFIACKRHVRRNEPQEIVIVFIPGQMIRVCG